MKKTIHIITCFFILILIIISTNNVIANSHTINYMDGSDVNAFNLLASGTSYKENGRIFLRDPSYIYADFIVYFGEGGAEYIANWSKYEYVIFTSNHTTEWVINVSNLTEAYGYINITDYNIDNCLSSTGECWQTNGCTDSWGRGDGSPCDTWNRTVWMNDKINDIDVWTGISDDVNIFIDGLDYGVANDDGLFGDALTDLTEYAKITKDRKTILNTYTSYADYSNLADMVMRESACSRWDGTINEPIYTYEDIELDVERANFQKANGQPILLQSFGAKNDTERAYYCYMQSKVLYGDLGYYSYNQPDFWNYIAPDTDRLQWNYQLYPELGASIDDNYIREDDVFTRRFEKGTVTINTTSKTVDFQNDITITRMEFCGYYQDNGGDTSNNEGAVNFRVNSIPSQTFRVYDDDLPHGVKMEKCVDIPLEYYTETGLYELEFWYIDLDGNVIANGGLFMFNSIKEEDGVSFYENTETGLHPPSSKHLFVPYSNKRNWEVKFTIHRIFNTINLTLNNPINNFISSNNSVDFGATIISNTYPFVTCNLTINGLINESNQIFNNNTPKNISISGFNQGNHTWFYSCWDADNFTVSSEVQEFIIDFSPPIINYYNISENASYVDNELYIWANFADTITEIDTVWLNVNGIINKTNSSDNLNNNLVNFSYIIPTEMEFTTINFTISANDSAGNSITTGILEVLVYDSSAPIIILNNPIDYYNTSEQNISFNFSVLDTDDNLYCNLTINGVINQSYLSCSNETIFNHPNIFNEGIYFWNLTCWDSCGNTNTSETRTFTIDLTPPSAPLFTSDNITTTNYGAINLTWNIVNDAEKYMIYRNTSDFTITDESLWIANTTNNYYQDINTLSGVEYWYKIIAVDNVGNYNYSNASLSQNITSYDIITPRVPTSVNVTQNGNVATISWSEVLYDVEGNPDSFGLTYQIWVGNSINTSKNQINETLFFLKNVSENNSTTYSITSSDKYYFVVTTIDDGYNANLSFSNNNTANVSLTYTPPSNPSTGTPSSSGGGTVGGSNIPNPISSVVNEQNYYVGYVNQINANTPTDFKIDKTDIGVNLVTITLEKNKNNIGLEIKKINKPANIIKPTLKAYQFLEINLKNLDEVDSIKSVVFEFEVNNSWLLSESIDKYGVALLRYVNNTWVELETELISTDLLKTAYIGKSSGFSYFAIVGKEVKEELISSEINITDSYNESNINSESDEYIYEDTELDKEKIISHSMYNSYYLLFIFVIICVGIIIYFYFNKKVKKVK